KTVGDALSERISVNRVAEIIDVGNIFRFLRRGGQANVGGTGKLFEDLAPVGVLGGAAAMAFIDDNKVEEIGREFPVRIGGLFVAGNALIKRHIDLVGLVDLAPLDLGHFAAKRLEVVHA